MNWAHPLSAAEITGKQTLTGEKPITRIFRAVGEIQDLAVTAAKVDIEGITIEARVVGNTLEINGSLIENELPEGPQGPQGPAGPRGPAGTDMQLPSVGTSAAYKVLTVSAAGVWTVDELRARA